MYLILLKHQLKHYLIWQRTTFDKHDWQPATPKLDEKTLQTKSDYKQHYKHNPTTNNITNKTWLRLKWERVCRLKNFWIYLVPASSQVGTFLNMMTGVDFRVATFSHSQTNALNALKETENKKIAKQNHYLPSDQCLINQIKTLYLGRRLLMKLINAFLSITVLRFKININKST